MKPFSLTVSIFLAATVANPAACDLDLKVLLDRAAHQLAMSRHTSLNYQRLAKGICFSREDASSYDDCSKQPTGIETRNKATLTLWTASTLGARQTMQTPIRLAFKL